MLFIGLGFQEFFGVLLTFGFLALVFLALRTLLLWYWKINIIIENQEKQIALLSRLIPGAGFSGSSDPALAEKARKYDEMMKGSQR